MSDLQETLRGLELDALRRAERIRLITDGLSKLIDFDAYSAPMARSHVRRKALEALDGIDDLLQEVVDAETDSVTAPTVTAESMQGLALDGRTTLPIDDIEDEHDDEIVAAMQERVVAKFGGDEA